MVASTAEAAAEPDTAVLDESVEDDQGLIDIGESALSYFGADFDVAGLIRRLDDEDIIIPRFDPDESQDSQIQGFQRQRVWSAARMEKFIESLLLGWPIPSIFLVLEPDQRYLVLDGQQRLTSLQAFRHGRFPNGKIFRLHDVAQHLQGATYETLTKESKRRLNNTFIQATVIEPQLEAGGRESVYRLFGRLNSGGVTLTSQEIRVALYRGPIVDWVRELNHDPGWRLLFGKQHPRLKDHELILRSLALNEFLTKIEGKWEDPEALRKAYKPPMSDFLNSYLADHRDMQGIDVEASTAAFSSACDVLVRSSGNDALKFQGVLNAANVDAVLAVLMLLSRQGRLPAPLAVRQGLQRLRDSTAYAGFVSSSTSHRESVVGRLKLAMEALAS